jgi:hypothetical protein
LYDKGKGVPQDDKTAVKWFRLATEQGLAHAHFLLGLMYANGHEVIQDKVYAHKHKTPATWLEEAASIWKGFWRKKLLDPPLRAIGFHTSSYKYTLIADPVLFMHKLKYSFL